MFIYKDKQYLVFDFEDGKTVKYDFATKTSIGKSGKQVKNICSQLRGLTIDQFCDKCTDKQYGKFLKFIKENHFPPIKNIGKILDEVPNYDRFEQIFSAGINNVDSNFIYKINDVPKGLIKLCKEYDIKLTNDLVDFFNINPNGYILAYNMKYTSLTKDDIYSVTTCRMWKREPWRYVSYFNILIDEYGYTAKNLMLYLDRLKTFEAIENMNSLIVEIFDYARMMNEVSNKFDKYPRNFLTTHRIATRNYNRLKKEFNELNFKKRINKNMEKSFDKYVFIYPDCVQDVKDEAVSMNNCVASYIDSIIRGECHIMFLRLKDSPKESLVTIEVRNNKIVQALQKYNAPITDEQQEAVNKWNVWWKNKIEKEGDEDALIK